MIPKTKMHQIFGSKLMMINADKEKGKLKASQVKLQNVEETIMRQKGVAKKLQA